MRKVLVCLLLALPVRALCQSDLTGYDRFPQFRNLSGLGCGGYGLDAAGNASLSGPVAFSSPCAYVLGHDQLRVQYASISKDMSPDFRWGRTNNKLVGVFGHTFGPVNVAVSDIVKSRHWDQAFNLQAELIPTGNARLAGSIGVQDIGGGGGSSGTGEPGDERKSRSFFGVVTYQATQSVHPVYVSAGIGTRRFMNGFVNASVQVAQPARLWAEWDGFGFNFGALFAGQKKEGARTLEVDGLIGITDGRYLTAGITVGI